MVLLFNEEYKQYQLLTDNCLSILIKYLIIDLGTKNTPRCLRFLRKLFYFLRKIMCKKEYKWTKLQKIMFIFRK